MNIKSGLKIVLFVSGTLLLSACKDVWKEHLETIDQNNTITLLGKIESEPSLSKFYTYLKQTGLDSSLASSKSYTVWAPDNKAIDALIAQSPTYLSDPVTLKSFVAYHIGTQLHSSFTGKPVERILTLNGLYASFDGTRYEEAQVTKADQLVKNGILHIVDVALMVKPSVFIAAGTFTAAVQQATGMKALDTVAVDASGKTIIKRSDKWASLVNRLSSKDSLYTYFVLTDAAYNAELQKITPYYKSAKTRPDSTQSALTKIAMLENLVVRGLYLPSQLPDTLVSVAGVKMPIKKSAIISSFKGNNGIVYLISEMNFRLTDRVKEFRFEGEQTVNRIFSRTDKTANTFYRSKIDSLGVPYSDIEVYNHGTSEFYIQYSRPEVQTATYNVYARAVSNTVGDVQTAAFTQRFGTPITTAPATTQIIFTQLVSPLRYREILLGQYTVNQHGTMTWRLVSAASTSSNVNTLILDYLRFVPVLP